MSNDDERKLSIAQLQAVRDAVLSFAKLIREAYWVEGMQVPDEHPALRSILYRGFPALQKIERLTNPERLPFGTEDQRRGTQQHRRSFCFNRGLPDEDRLEEILRWIANLRDKQIEDWKAKSMCDSDDSSIGETIEEDPNFDDGDIPKELPEARVTAFEDAGKALSDYLAEYADISGDASERTQTKLKPVGQPRKGESRDTINRNIQDETEHNSGQEGMPTQSEYVFRRDGDGYYIKGFGEEGHLTAKSAKGLHDLFRLVETPRVPVLMLELEAGRGVAQLDGDHRSIQPMVDETGMRNIRNKLEQITAYINSIDPKSPDSRMEREEQERERDKLLAEANKVQGKKGVRDLNASDLNRMKANIAGRIKTACKQMKNDFPKLSEHFAVSTGAHESKFYRYMPAIPDMTWNTSANK